MLKSNYKKNSDNKIIEFLDSDKSDIFLASSKPIILDSNNNRVILNSNSVLSNGSSRLELHKGTYHFFNVSYDENRCKKIEKPVSDIDDTGIPF